MPDRDPPRPDPKSSADRESRLADALRANLKRRKAPKPPKTAPKSK